LLDRFAASYGWTVVQTTRCTIFQLNHLGKEMTFRIGQDRRIQLDMMRVAEHADKQQYDRFGKGLMPEGSDDGPRRRTKKKKGARKGRRTTGQTDDRPDMMGYTDKE